MNVPMNVLIVDDEPLAREGMQLLLKEEPSITSVTEARNGAEAVRLIRERRPDLVFLDVQMPELDGFGVLRTVGAEHMPPVIFVTAHDRYAIQAFEVNAIDYLLKPATRERCSQRWRGCANGLPRAPTTSTCSRCCNNSPRRRNTWRAWRCARRAGFPS
jgi:two-component system LytT family response regulator